MKSKLKFKNPTLPYVESIALCDKASISNQKKMSMVNIFDIWEDKPPAYLKADLAVILVGKPNTKYLLYPKLTTRNSNKNILGFNPITPTTSLNGKNNIIISLHVQLNKSGQYFLSIVHNKKNIGMTRFTLDENKKN